MTSTTRTTVSISSNCTSSTEARMVVVRSVSTVTWTADGSDALQLRQQLLDAVDHLDDVGAGLALDVDDDGRPVVHPGRLPDVLGAVDHVGHVGEQDAARCCDRRSRAPDTAALGEQLVVGADRERLAGPVEACPWPGSRWRRRRAARTSSRVRPLAASRAGLTWMRTAGFWPPLMVTRPTPGSCEIFCARRVSARSCDRRERQRVARSRASVRIGASAGLTLL